MMASKSRGSLPSRVKKPCEEAVRRFGETVARLMGVENAHRPAGPCQIDGRGQTSEASADDDDVILH